jgi:hypothetical protein
MYRVRHLQAGRLVTKNFLFAGKGSGGMAVFHGVVISHERQQAAAGKANPAMITLK